MPTKKTPRPEAPQLPEVFAALAETLAYDDTKEARLAQAQLLTEMSRLVPQLAKYLAYERGRLAREIKMKDLILYKDQAAMIDVRDPVMSRIARTGQRPRRKDAKVNQAAD